MGNFIMHQCSPTAALGTGPILELARKQNKRRMKGAGRYLIKFHEGVTKIPEKCNVRPEESRAALFRSDFRGGKQPLCVSGGTRRRAQDDFMPPGPPQSAGRRTQCYLQVGAPVHTANHPLANTQEFLTHSSDRRRDLYSNVASSDLGWGKSHFNNEQDQEEVIKHAPRKVEAG